MLGQLVFLLGVLLGRGQLPPSLVRSCSFLGLFQFWFMAKLAVKFMAGLVVGFLARLVAGFKARLVARCVSHHATRLGQWWTALS